MPLCPTTGHASVIIAEYYCLPEDQHRSSCETDQNKQFSSAPHSSLYQFYTNISLCTVSENNIDEPNMRNNFWCNIKLVPLLKLCDRIVATLNLVRLIFVLFLSIKCIFIVIAKVKKWTM